MYVYQCKHSTKVIFSPHFFTLTCTLTWMVMLTPGTAWLIPAGFRQTDRHAQCSTIPMNSMNARLEATNITSTWRLAMIFFFSSGALGSSSSSRQHTICGMKQEPIWITPNVYVQTKQIALLESQFPSWPEKNSPVWLPAAQLTNPIYECSISKWRTSWRSLCWDEFFLSLLIVRMNAKYFWSSNWISNNLPSTHPTWMLLCRLSFPELRKVSKFRQVLST